MSDTSSLSNSLGQSRTHLFGRLYTTKWSIDNGTEELRLINGWKFTKGAAPHVSLHGEFLVSTEDLLGYYSAWNTGIVGQWGFFLGSTMTFWGRSKFVAKDEKMHEKYLFLQQIQQSLSLAMHLRVTQLQQRSGELKVFRSTFR